MQFPFTIAILAGGRSSRFGFADKQELVVQGDKLGRVVAKNALARSKNVVVIGRNGRPYESLPVGRFDDIVAGFGPISGLHAALSFSETEWVYLVACDMPFFLDAWLDYVVSCAAEDESSLAVVARYGSHIEPFHGLYSKKLLEHLDEKIAAARGRSVRLSFSRLLDGVPHHAVPENVVRTFTPDWRLFVNINSPDDLQRFS